MKTGRWHETSGSKNFITYDAANSNGQVCASSPFPFPNKTDTGRPRWVPTCTVGCVIRKEPWAWGESTLLVNSKQTGSRKRYYFLSLGCSLPREYWDLAQKKWPGSLHLHEELAGMGSRLVADCLSQHSFPSGSPLTALYTKSRALRAWILNTIRY